jgi:hypothetical protein
MFRELHCSIRVLRSDQRAALLGYIVSLLFCLFLLNIFIHTCICDFFIYIFFSVSSYSSINQDPPPPGSIVCKTLARSFLLNNHIFKNENEIKQST